MKLFSKNKPDTHTPNNRFVIISVSIAHILLIAPAMTLGYPIDGYEYSGIRRLERLRLINEGILPGEKLPAGGLKSIHDITLHLVGERGAQLDTIPDISPDFQKEIDALFPNLQESYAVAVMDITPGKPIRLALRQEHRGYVPGSVGKLAVVTGLFFELKKLYPDSIEKRRHILRTRMVKGGKWIISDHHTVPTYDPATRKYSAAPPQESDVFSLYEWTDHMLSPSANAAASVVWKELILMRAFGDKYPPSFDQEQEFFSKTPKKDLTSIVMSVVNDPLRKLGIEEKDWRLGNMFTRMGKILAPGEGGSTATPWGLLQFLIALERGKIADEWSCLEIKRLMYMTGRRIRYASSPALLRSAVYFKSGSQYKCRQETGFQCKKYHGNVENYMNSVAIVEHPNNERVYFIIIMSNVLRKNSAFDHQTLATQIDKIIAK